MDEHMEHHGLKIKPTGLFIAARNYKREPAPRSSLLWRSLFVTNCMLLISGHGRRNFSQVLTRAFLNFITLAPPPSNPGYATVNTVNRVLRSPDILLCSCYDNTLW